MFRSHRLSAFALCAVSLALLGCGASPVQSAATQAAPVLSGDYLLAGSLPAPPLTVPNVSFGLAATFNTIGSQVAAIYSVSIPCATNSFGFSGGGNLTGLLATDGSFTLQSVSLGGATAVQLTIKGFAPTATGAGWSGTYTLTTTNTACPGTLTGIVNATAIAPVSGSYAGTASVAASGSLTGLPVSVTGALQQGIPITNSYGDVLQTNVSLGGTLTVKGSSCLTSGVPLATAGVQGGVEGTIIFANFQMNDGSTVEMLGSIASMDASRLSVSFLTTSAGSCGLGFVSGTVSISR